MKKFKPNLIPNNPKDGSFDRDATILKNGGYDKYLIAFKKDGVRLQIIDGQILGRSLKKPNSESVIERFLPLAKACENLKISLDGEFYSHGRKFNQIYRFFSKKNVTDKNYINKLSKQFLKNEVKKGKDKKGNPIILTFEEEYETNNLKELTIFHEDLKLYLFDGIVLDRPDLKGFKERISEIMKRLKTLDNDLLKYLVMPYFYFVNTEKQLDILFHNALALGFEGLVLTHKDHEYKLGRNTLNEGTILKVKNDALEYDGIVLDVLEGTIIRDGVSTSINELGRSCTSKKKGDRIPSGMAKGLLIQFEDKGTFCVGLRSFSDSQKKELLLRKKEAIGRNFTYTAMTPVKDFPRHAFFKNWRDEK